MEGGAAGSASDASAALFPSGGVAAYRSWRDEKLARLERAARFAPIPIADPCALTGEERESLLSQMSCSNMALYRFAAPPPDEQALDGWLLAFSAQFGLRAVEDHRSANRNGVVRIENVGAGGRGVYIPYTDRPISWHTDGYYNYHGPERAVRAMALHCARAAESGGENRLLDFELAFIRLRDADEAALRLLFHPCAMTIPEATDDAGRFRARNAGPVFFTDGAGHLAMRYTARKKFVEWRDEPTRAAASALLALIEAEPLVLRVKMAAGEGVLCNNVLHDRTGFADGAGGARLLRRIRFHNVIEVEERTWRGSAN